MKCTKCGKPIKRGAQFCTNCGAPVTKAAAPAAEPEAASPVAAPPTAAPAAVRQKKPHSRKKVVLLIVCIVLALAVIGAGVFFVLRLLNPVSRVMSALESGDYTKALSIYEDKVEGDREKDSTLSEDVVAYLEKCQDDFLNERMSYEQFTGVINGIRSLALNKLSSKLDDAADYADMLNQSRIAYQTAESFYDKQDYGSAIGYYNQVNYQDTYYDDAQSKCAECVTNYRQQVLDSAEEQIAKADYTGALATLKSGLDVLKDDASLMAKYNDVTSAQKDLAIQELINQAKQQHESGDLKGAIKTLASGQSKYEDEGIKQLYSSYVEECKDQMTSEAEQAFASGGHTAAIDVIDTYTDVLTSDDYSDLWSYYYFMAPIPLSQMYTFNGYWSRSGSISTSLGDSYQDVLAEDLYTNSYSRDVEYHIDGAYVSISGIVAISDDSHNSDDAEGHIEIYGDDVLLYSSASLTRKSAPESFDVSLRGVEFLKISVVKDTESGLSLVEVMLGDTVLNQY